MQEDIKNLSDLEDVLIEKGLTTHREFVPPFLYDISIQQRNLKPYENEYVECKPPHIRPSTIIGNTLAFAVIGAFIYVALYMMKTANNASGIFFGICVGLFILPFIWSIIFRSGGIKYDIKNNVLRKLFHGRVVDQCDLENIQYIKDGKKKMLFVDKAGGIRMDISKKYDGKDILKEMMSKRGIYSI